MVSGLKQGRVIRIIQVNWVTFCPGQADLTRILHQIMCINNGSDPDQTNELSVLDSDDGSIFPGFLYHMLKD